MKPRALIVEDRAEVARMYATALEVAGFEVFLAKNLSEAFVCLMQPPAPDVVLLDLNLSETETAQFTVTKIPDIKQYNPNMAIIVVSGVLTPDLIKLATLQGATDTREKLDMTNQVTIWRVVSEALEKAPQDMKSRLASTLAFFRSAATKLSIALITMKLSTITLLIAAASLSFQGCTTTETTTTSPDGTVVTVKMRQADGKTLRALVQAGGQVLSAAAAAELNRRAEEQRNR